MVCSWTKRINYFYILFRSFLWNPSSYNNLYNSFFFPPLKFLITERIRQKFTGRRMGRYFISRYLEKNISCVPLAYCFTPFIVVYTHIVSFKWDFFFLFFSLNTFPISSESRIVWMPASQREVSGSAEECGSCAFLFLWKRDGHTWNNQFLSKPFGQLRAFPEVISLSLSVLNKE